MKGRKHWHSHHVCRLFIWTPHNNFLLFFSVYFFFLFLLTQNIQWYIFSFIIIYARHSYTNDTLTHWSVLIYYVLCLFSIFQLFCDQKDKWKNDFVTAKESYSLLFFYFYFFRGKQKIRINRMRIRRICKVLGQFLIGKKGIAFFKSIATFFSFFFSRVLTLEWENVVRQFGIVEYWTTK